MTWSALVPGLREVRGPLLAGYLWMLAIWLSLGDRLPNSESDEVFRRLWEAGEAIGPVGRAAAASVVAYLIGILMNGVIRGSTRFLWAKIAPGAIKGLEAKGDPSEIENRQWVPIEEILKLTGKGWESDSRAQQQSGTLAMLVNLEEVELSGAQAGLEGAIRHATDLSGGSARFQALDWRNERLAIAIPRSDQDLIEITIPRFSPYRDIWLKRPLLETRLRELVPPTASKIERLDYEAEFRESLVPPLIAIFLVIALQASLHWAALLVIPLALLVQALRLRESAGKELVDALRARSATEDLERITPVFQIYRAEAKKLEEALIAANWNNLRFLEEAVVEELEGQG
jgi:hypothetical protein